MNPILLKSLIGIGVLGTTTAASVGGYYWLSSPAPRTIGEKLKNKVLVGPYMTSDEDTVNKGAWTTKKTNYSTAENVEETILQKNDLSEKKLSDKCQEILNTPLSDSNLEKKERWATNWCFK